MHRINHESDGNREQNDAIELIEEIIVGHGDNSDRCASKEDGGMHPCQEGSLVGEEYFGLDFYGRLPFFHEGSDGHVVGLENGLGSSGVAK